MKIQFSYVSSTRKITQINIELGGNNMIDTNSKSSYNNTNTNTICTNSDNATSSC